MVLIKWSRMCPGHCVCLSLEGIKGLEEERTSLQTQAEHYTEQVGPSEAWLTSYRPTWILQLGICWSSLTALNTSSLSYLSYLCATPPMVDLHGALWTHFSTRCLRSNGCSRNCWSWQRCTKRTSWSCTGTVTHCLIRNNSKGWGHLEVSLFLRKKSTVFFNEDNI